MERLIKSFILMFFVPFHVFSCDFTYLESKIPPDGFERRIFETIKNVIEKGTSERDLNLITFLWNGTKVEIIEDARTKTRGYDNPDTMIIFTYQTLKRLEEVIIIDYNQKADFYRFIVRKAPMNTQQRNAE